MAGVEVLNRDLNIPTHLEALRAQDVPALARAACKEAHLGYPVPRYMTISECESLIRRLMPVAAARQKPRTAAAKRPTTKKDPVVKAAAKPSPVRRRTASPAQPVTAQGQRPARAKRAPTNGRVTRPAS